MYSSVSKYVTNVPILNCGREHGHAPTEKNEYNQKKLVSNLAKTVYKIFI